MVRTLLMRLPKHILHRFSWDHPCSIDTVTLDLLFKYHGGSLRDLGFRLHKAQKEGTDLGQKRLCSLQLADICLPNENWATKLLVQNHDSLRHLKLGIESRIEKQYAKTGQLEARARVSIDETQKLFEGIREHLQNVDETMDGAIPLKSLSLIGLDVSALLTGLELPLFDLKNLRTLSLESCVGLEAAFSQFESRRPLTDPFPLHTFVLRHERLSNDFLEVLKTFLINLAPLKTLHILLEGSSTNEILKEVLDVHGCSLRSLVWDIRNGARSSARVDPSVFSSEENFWELKVISQRCTQLKALGLAVNWKILEDDSQWSNVCENVILSILTC